MKTDVIATLKGKLLVAQDFSAVMDLFLDGVESDEGLIREAEACEPPQALLATIATACAKVLGTKPGLHTIVGSWLRLPRHRFVHGSFSIAGKMAIAIYFEDVRTGMLAVSAMNLRGPTTFMRFKVVAPDMN